MKFIPGKDEVRLPKPVLLRKLEGSKNVVSLSNFFILMDLFHKLECRYSLSNVQNLNFRTPTASLPQRIIKTI